MLTEPHFYTDTDAMDECRLYEVEIFWRDHYLWLKQKGYLLRPRYNPEWVASWKTSNEQWLCCEDGQAGTVRTLDATVKTLLNTIMLSQKVPILLDATRISDGKLVTLKRIITSLHPNEGDIGLLFSSEPHASHPSNHCIPVYEVFEIPDVQGTVMMVMPHCTEWYIPQFATVGEVVSFVKQLFEVSIFHRWNEFRSN